MGHSLPETQPQNIARQLADDKKKDCSNTANDVSGTCRILRIFEIRFAEKAAQPNSDHGGMTELKEDNHLSHLSQNILRRWSLPFRRTQ